MILTKKISFFLMILCVVSGCRVLSEKLNKSGVEFDVQVISESSDKEKTLEQAIAQIERKMNLLGIDGEAAKTDGKSDELSVKIYDKSAQNTQELDRIRNVLFTSHQLELKKVDSNPSPALLRSYDTEESARQSAKDGQEVLPFKDASGVSKFLIVEKQAIVANNDIREAEVVNGNNYSIAFSLNSEGAKKLGDWTGKNIGNYLAIVLDKKVISAPFIRSQISDSGQIDGRFSKAEAEEIVSSLKSGDAPLTFKILSEKPTGK